MTTKFGKSSILSVISIFILFGNIQAQDPDDPDTLIVGNLDGTPLLIGLNRVINIPVWLKNDEDVAYVLIPVGTDDQYIASRLGGHLFYPLTEWDDVSFVPEDYGHPNQPEPGYSTQSIMGYKELSEPFDNPFLNTNGEFIKIAEFRIQGAIDTTNFNDTTYIIEGYDPAQGGVLFGDSTQTISWAPVFIGGPILFVEEIPPGVDSTYPGRNAQNIPVDTVISVYFDVDMNESTINDSTFLVYAQSSGPRQGIISYDSLMRRATFDPVIIFNEGEIVTVTLTTGIESFDSVSMLNGYVWSFTTDIPQSSGQFDSLIFSPVTNEPEAIFCADLTGDDFADVILANPDSNNISVLINQGDSTFIHNADYSVGLSPRSIYAADYDNDNDIDIAVANSGSDNITLLRNNGNGTFLTFRETYDTGGSSWGIFGADFNGDGNIDLATANMDSSTVSILLNNGNGEFPVHIDYPAGNLPRSIYAADLDNDSDIDIILGNTGTDSLSVILNNGDGTFPILFGSYDTDGSSWGIFGADFDGDTYMDVAVIDPDSGRVVILINDSTGAYPVIDGSYDTEDGSWGVFGGDFDGDGDMDLVVSNSNSGDSIAVFLNDSTGVFPEPATHYYINGDGWGIFVSDMDGDGSPDLVVANSNPSGVSVRLNGIVGCEYVMGDVNGTDSYNGLDITYGVNFFKNTGSDPTCAECLTDSCNFWYYCGDVNSSCSYNGLDITYGVNYFKGGPAPIFCQNCPPIDR